MARQVIQIDEEKCVGCGLCVTACLENVIEIVDGKAKVVREEHCDGLGRCLPKCPTDAIQFKQVSESSSEKASTREGNEGAEKKQGNAFAGQGGCAGSRAMSLHTVLPTSSAVSFGVAGATSGTAFSGVSDRGVPSPSRLGQWPCQIKLVPTRADFFQNAHLLIAADCSAFAYGAFHEDFMKNKVTIIGCPKLDEGDYTEKLTEILKNNEIKSMTVVRMEVPCCTGIQTASRNALQNSGKFIPWQVVTITRDGRVIRDF